LKGLTNKIINNLSSEKEVADKIEHVCPHCGKGQDKESTSNLFESKKNSKQDKDSTSG
jgi:hypothetical protein